MNEDHYNIRQNYPYVQYAILITISIAFIYQIVGGILYYIMKDSYESSALFITGFSQLLLMLIPTMIFARSTPIEFNEIFRLKRKPKMLEYGIAIVGLIAVNMIASGVSDLQELLIPDSLMHIYKEIMQAIDEMYNEMLSFDSLEIMLLSILFGAFVPGLTEEFLIRGFLQRSLEEKLKPIYSILIAAFIFAGMHLNPIDFLPLMLIGSYLGLLAYITKSIWVPVLIHILNNAIAIIVMGNIDYDESPLGRGDWSNLISLASIAIGSLILFGLVKALINAVAKDNINQE